MVTIIIHLVPFSNETDIGIHHFLYLFYFVTVISIYSSRYDRVNQTFRHEDNTDYQDASYEMVEVNIFMEGSFTFTMNNSFYIYIFIYKYGFDPSNPYWNLITSSFDQDGIEKFKMEVFLQPDIKYFLIIKTDSIIMSANEFFIIVSGSSRVNFTRTIIIPKGMFQKISVLYTYLIKTMIK